MAKNKIITSQGNVQFINSKGKTISIHPMHCYAVYQDDTVSFLFIYMKEYSGQAFFSSQFEDLEVDGVTYDSLDALKEAIAEAFAKAGAQARTEIVDELPETGYTNTIYLVPKEDGTGYDEYVYTEEGEWELIGDTDIELERYLKKVDFNEYSASTKEKIDFISGAVDDNASDIQFISGAVDTEISNREAADAVISGAVDTLSTNLSNEVQRAQNAEQTLQNNINTVNSRVDAEQIARANADNALSGAIDSVVSDLASEASRATAKENEIDSKVDGEISDREAADAVISGAVDTLSANLSLEVQRAQNAESALDSKVNALSGESVTSGDVESMIDEAVSGKQDTLIAGENITINGNVISASGGGQIIIDPSLDSGSTNAVANSAITTAILSNEAVTSAALNDLNNRKAELSAMTFELSLKQDTLSAGTGIDITDNVISSIATGEQSDWNESDQNSEAFIKNKPFGGTGGYKTVIYCNENKTVDFTDSTLTEFCIPLTLGNSYHIGAMTEYQEVTPQNIDYISFDFRFAGTVENNNTGMYSNYAYIIGYKEEEPWDVFAVSNDLKNWAFMNANRWGEYLVIWNLELDPLIQLDSKYIKDDIARTSALNNKQDTLVSGTNIKTINNESILGSGNIDIQDGGSSYTAGDGINITNDVISVTGKVDTTTYNTYTAATNTALASKQTTLTAGTGISIVNNVISSTATGEQSDWDESNSGSTAYIKNRPFYEETIGDEVLVPDRYVTNRWIFNSSNPISVGDNVYVQMSNTQDFSTIEQEIGGVVRSADDANSYCGTEVYDSPTVVIECDDGMGGGIKLWSWDKSAEGSGYFWTLAGYEITYPYARLVKKGSGSIIHKLDSKFIDSDIARSSRLGGLSLVKLTSAEYDALATKDSNTLYIISD